MKGTIKLNKEFVYAYRKAKKIVTPILVMHFYKNRTSETKFGITVSKTLGKAHSRNRVKRLIREAYYKEKHNFPGGYNIIFVARTKTAYASFEDVLGAMRECIENSGFGQGDL